MAVGIQKKLLRNTAALIFPALLASSCGGAEGEHKQAPAESHGHDESLIELADEQAARLGVEADTIVPAPFATSIRCSGLIERSAADQATASAPAAGLLTLNVSVGRPVNRGEVIGRINTAAVSGGDSNASAKAALDAARREVERLEPLFNERLATAAELNAARAALAQAEALYSPDASGRVITAPRSGVVTELQATDGSYVQAGQPVATVAADSRLTLHAETPVSSVADLASVTDARIGDFTLSEHGGRKGGISSENGYACVYFTFDNDGSQLPGAGVEVYLLGQLRENVISVPLTAVTEQQGEHFVYLRHSPGHYVKQPVTLGSSDGRRVEITSGLKGGEAVVTSGAMTVRLAESSGAIPEGHSHQH